MKESSLGECSLINANYRGKRYVRWIAVATYSLQHCETGRAPTGFSGNPRKQAVLCLKKRPRGFPSESVSNPSYSEVHMVQATTLQPGKIRRLLLVTAATSRSCTATPASGAVRRTVHDGITPHPARRGRRDRTAAAGACRAGSRSPVSPGIAKAHGRDVHKRPLTAESALPRQC